MNLHIVKITPDKKYRVMDDKYPPIVDDPGVKGLYEWATSSMGKKALVSLDIDDATLYRAYDASSRNVLAHWLRSTTDLRVFGFIVKACEVGYWFMFED